MLAQTVLGFIGGLFVASVFWLVVMALCFRD